MKEALLTVSFGTAVEQARQADICAVERAAAHLVEDILPGGFISVRQCDFVYKQVEQTAFKSRPAGKLLFIQLFVMQGFHGHKTPSFS